MSFRVLVTFQIISHTGNIEKLSTIKRKLLSTEQTNRIFIGMDINEVMEINDKDYSITIAMYFNVEWQEPRLELAPHENSNKEEEVFISTSVDLIKDLWLPNPFIHNLKTFKLIDGVMSKLSGLWVTTDKDLMYSQSTLITFICPMRFDKFPFDIQICQFRVGSYNLDSSKLLFITNNFGITYFYLIFRISM